MTLTTTTFESLNPRTGELLASYPIHSAEHVQAVVADAHTQADWWREQGFEGRKRLLRSWKCLITSRIHELARLVQDETGKPQGDALLEAALGIDHLSYAASHAKKILGPKRVSSGLFMANQTATLRYHPLGVVGVIGPWNYPVFTPMGSIAYALAAGNAVVFKPSEYTPGVGVWLARTFAEAVGHPVLQTVTGFGATGHALSTSGANKLAFTGSANTAKKVMAACAETLTPIVVEAGGKDALLVDSDADLDAAADAAAWGAFANAGQTCAGVERIYVHQDVYDPFLEKLVALAREVTADVASESKIGPITMPSQLELIRSHIDDAITRGGRALVGGLDAVGERFVQPTVLVDVPEDSLAVTEETFGPTVVVAKVATMEQAVDRANATQYGLGAAVFSKARGTELADKIRSGMASVNGIIAYAGVPSLPFGGVGASGFGRIHGADGLREFSYAKSITHKRLNLPLNPTSFARTSAQDRHLTRLVTLLHGYRGLIGK